MTMAEVSRCQKLIALFAAKAYDGTSARLRRSAGNTTRLIAMKRMGGSKQIVMHYITFWCVLGNHSDVTPNHSSRYRLEK